MIQFLELPTFGDWIAWDVVEDSTNDHSLTIHRTTWRRQRDLEILTSPVERMKYGRDYAPTIDTRSAVVPLAGIEQVRRQFAETELLLLADSTTIALDGTSFELALAARGRESSVRLCWHNELPAAWAEIVPAVASLRGLFSDAFEG
ncbi:MAG: hypothetical protein IT450_11650 [Phycisphaerales bacterium]|nr:hypothetical protein [Phycisphaerales bacterium]